MLNKLNLLSRRVKQYIVALLDVVLSLIATWCAFGLRLDSISLPSGYQQHVYLLAVVLGLVVFSRFGLYKAVFRYTGIAAMMTIGKAIGVYCAVLFPLLLWLGLPNVPRSVGLLQPLILFVLIASSRACARVWFGRVRVDRRTPVESRLLIYGAGAAGAQIADALQQQKNLKLVGFIDDDPHLAGRTINGCVVHSPDKVSALIAKHMVSDVLLAMPAISRARRNEILESLRKQKVHIRSLPDIVELAQGKVGVSDIHELDITDLLGREPVPPHPELMSRNISGSVVMVSGAGGSIGSELCRQILAVGPTKLILLEHSEYSLYKIHADLSARAAELGVTTELIPLLGSVRHYDRLLEICNAWKPQTVYHAAAYKHVPLVEQNPAEGIKNNVFGTYNLARAAVESGVTDFVLISTDKAVRPTNVMGASKRLAEMILQALATTKLVAFWDAGTTATPVANNTRFSMVRFGNVLGSSGSVVPLFRRQIKDGGPVTVTDTEVTRYFMTIPEAAQLVVQAGAMTEGGDVFVLDMGEPVKIVDLAFRMIELSGLVVKDEEHPDGDIEIKVTGLRPGEKLYEELLIGANPQSTTHPRIMKAHEAFLPWDTLAQKLLELGHAVDGNDVETIRDILRELVTGYVAPEDFVDLIYARVNS